MFRTGLQLQFTYLKLSIIFVKMCLKNNRKREIIKRNYANYKFRSSDLLIIILKIIYLRECCMCVSDVSE